MKRTNRSTLATCLLCAVVLLAASAPPALAQPSTDDGNDADEGTDPIERLLSLLVELVFDDALADGRVTVGEVVSAATSPTVQGMLVGALSGSGAGTTPADDTADATEATPVEVTRTADPRSASSDENTGGADTVNQNAASNGATNAQDRSSAAGSSTRSSAVDEETLDDAEDNRQVRRAIRNDGDIPNALLTGDEETQRELLDDPETRQAIRENGRIRRAVLTDPDLREELVDSENGTDTES